MATNCLHDHIARLIAVAAVTATGAPLLAHSEQGRTATDYREQPPEFEAGYDGELIIERFSEVDVAAGPGVNGFGSELYVVVRDDNVLITIDDERRIRELAELDVVFPQGVASSPTFDVLGLYSGALLVNEARYQEQAEVAPDGDARPSDITEGLDSELTLGFDPTGMFGGQLFVVDARGDLYTVSPQGSINLFATGVGHGGLCFVESGDCGPALYVADGMRRRVVRLTPGHVRGQPAPVWVDFAGNGSSVRPVSLAISRDGSFGTDVVYVADGASGRITRLDADGDPDGHVVAGLRAGPTTIELPRSGMFADTMVIANGGRIWAARAEADGSHSERDRWFGVDDLRLVVLNLGSRTGGAADVDANGRVDLADLVMVLGTGFLD